jgi:hypothetical protein
VLARPERVAELSEVHELRDLRFADDELRASLDFLVLVRKPEGERVARIIGPFDDVDELTANEICYAHSDAPPGSKYSVLGLDEGSPKCSPSSWPGDTRADAVRAARDGLAACRRSGWPPNEGPDTWNPYDVVGHLIHGERTDWMARADIILGGGGTFATFDSPGAVP